MDQTSSSLTEPDFTEPSRFWVFFIPDTVCPCWFFNLMLVFPLLSMFICVWDLSDFLLNSSLTLRCMSGSKWPAEVVFLLFYLYNKKLLFYIQGIHQKQVMDVRSFKCLTYVLLNLSNGSLCFTPPSFHRWVKMTRIHLQLARWPVGVFM